MNDATNKTVRRLSAILSTDVAGYSRLMSEDEQATIETITKFRALFTETIEENQGRVVDSSGDNILAEFASAVDAVACSVAVQKQLLEQNGLLLPNRRMEFRIGINVGDIVVDSDRIYGDGVNIAARIESLADNGGICISNSVYDQVADKLGLTFEDLGAQSLKNIARPVQVHRVILDTAASPTNAGDTTTVFGKNVDLSIPEDKPSIAVLPFLNLSGDAQQEYFSDGMTEDLITDLSKISGLFVISRNSVFTYKNVVTRPETISRELGVRYILEGSVRRAGDRVRISAQLLDAKSDYHLWADRYDGKLDDIFSLQDDVIQKIVAALAITLTRGEQARIGKAPTDNVDAHDAFLRGREEYARRERIANGTARALFEKAIELDPTFAEAYAFLGRTYIQEHLHQWSDADNLVEKVYEFGRRAVALDDAQPTAHITLALAYLATYDHDQAIAEARRAIEFDPNFADGYVTLAEILIFAGQPLEAISNIEHAMRLNPHFTPNYLTALGSAHRIAENFDDAIKYLRRALARTPDHFVSHLILTISYVEIGEIELARAQAKELLQVSPNFSAKKSRNLSPYRDKAISERTYNRLLEAGLA